MIVINSLLSSSGSDEVRPIVQMLDDSHPGAGYPSLKDDAVLPAIVAH